jgi:hypothetical protein
MVTAGPGGKFPFIPILFRLAFSVSNQAPLLMKAGQNMVSQLHRSTAL